MKRLFLFILLLSLSACSSNMLEKDMLMAEQAAGTGASYPEIDSLDSGTYFFVWDDNAYGTLGAGNFVRFSKSNFDIEVSNNSVVAANTAKLAGIEPGATADLTAAEIEGLLDGYLGSTDWRSAATAANTAFVPNGSIAATNVQAAIQEVRDESVQFSSLPTVAASGEYADLLNKPSIPQSGIDFDPVGTDNSGLTTDQKAAITNATTPSAVNPFVTQNELPTNTDSQTLSISGNDLSITGGNTVTIPGGAVDSVNAQTGVVVLDTDDVSDTTATNKYVTAAEKTLLASALQPGDVSSTPTTGATSVPISSGWAYTLINEVDPFIQYLKETDAGAAAYLNATDGVIGDVVKWVNDGSGNASLPIDVSGSSITDTGNYFTTDTIDGALQELGAGGGGTDDQTAAEVNIIDAGGYYTGTTVEAALQEAGEGIAGISVGSPLVPVPTYSDETCTAGTYAIDHTNDLIYYCYATNMWDRFSVTFADWSNPTPITYSLTVDLVDGNSTDKFTYLSTDYTTDQTFTGLSAESTFTITPDSGRTYSFSGTGCADSSGTVICATDAQNSSAQITFSDVVASVCSGSELFCTSWEDGSDALNTGGAYVFDSSSGSPARSTDAAFDGTYGVASPNSGGSVTTTNGGTYYSALDAYARLVFRLDGSPEALGVGVSQTILSLYNESSYSRVRVSVVEDAEDYDEYYLLRLGAKTTTATLVTVGTDYTIQEGIWYQLIVAYNDSGNAVGMTLYDAGGSILNTWSTSMTESAAIESVTIGATANIPLHIDAFSFDSSVMGAL